MGVKMIIKDKVLKNLVKRLAKLDNRQVQVGVLASKGGNEDRDGITMVELAAVHEFGSPSNGIPQRSFIGSTFNDRSNQREVARMMGVLLRAIIAKKISTDQAYNVLGVWGASKVQRHIKQGIPPKNAASTIARKGSSTPLIDTGKLLGSINFEVK